MAYRTTSTKVQSILGRNYDGCADLTPHIQTANSVVSKAVSKAAANGESIDTTTAALMEMWLSAYFYTVTDPIYTSKSTLSANGSWAVDREMYKKAAMELDDTGWLQAIISKTVAGIMWGGKTAAEAIPFRERIGYNNERS